MAYPQQSPAPNTGKAEERERYMEGFVGLGVPRLLSVLSITTARTLGEIILPDPNVILAVPLKERERQCTMNTALYDDPIEDYLEAVPVIQGLIALRASAERPKQEAIRLMRSAWVVIYFANEHKRDIL